MPRAGYTSALDFIRGEQNHSPCNEFFDFCAECYEDIRPVHDGDEADYFELRVAMDIPKEVPDKFIFWDDEHPYYDGEEYHCHACDKLLTKADD